MVHADDCGADAGGNTGIPQLRERKNRLPGYAAGACQLAAQAVETEPVPQFNDPGILRSTKPGGQDHLSRLRFPAYGHKASHDIGKYAQALRL